MGVGLSTLDEVADALYSGPPDTFVAQRSEAAAAARAAGDMALAQAITKLRRPTLGAWYVNLAARSSLVSLREWFALGRDLRQATTAGDVPQIRALSSQRTALENRVIADLSGHLTALGATPSAATLTEVRATLHAALADADAADAVAAGRLSRALGYAGFGEVDIAPTLSIAANSTPPETAPPPDPAQSRALAAATAAVTQAEEALLAAENEALAAERDVADHEAKIAQITDRLRTAQAALEADRRRLAGTRPHVEAARSALATAREEWAALEGR